MSPPDRDKPQVHPDVVTPVPDTCRCRAASRSPLPGKNGAVLAGLAHLYICDGLSTYRIAQLAGLDRQRVTRLLRRAGVPLRPRGAGGIRPERRRGDPANLAGILAELYGDRRLTTAQIGEMLGIPGRTVRDRLRRYGIQARTKGGCQREDRRILPADALWALYGLEGLSADDVGRKLDTSRKTVLRTAHDLGFPVRTGGAMRQPGPAEIQLISALYADALVDAVLTEHKIPHVPAGGPIWQRFPEPVPLSRQLVEDLYRRCGVGLNHIELLTGQPAQTVRGFMRRTGIASRHPGGGRHSSAGGAPELPASKQGHRTSRGEHPLQSASGATLTARQYCQTRCLAMGLAADRGKSR